MRTSRFIAGVAAASLLGLTPIALSAPAQAAGQTYTAVINLEINPQPSSSTGAYTYGQSLWASGSVTDPSGLYTPSGGTAQLQVLTTSNPVWTTIATDDSPGFLFFDPEGWVASENAQYKVVFSGSPAKSSYDDTFLAAESAPVTTLVQRNVVFKNKRTTLYGKITPDFGGKKIKVEKKVRGKWKKYKSFKTKGNGKFRFKLPAPRRGKWYWQITVPGDSRFAPWVTQGSTYSYRTAAKTLAPRVAIGK